MTSRSFELCIFILFGSFAGGFGADFTSNSLLAQYRPDLLHLPTTNGEHCTGDGIKMGEAGAEDMSGAIRLRFLAINPLRSHRVVKVERVCGQYNVLVLCIMAVSLRDKSGTTVPAISTTTRVLNHAAKAHTIGWDKRKTSGRQMETRGRQVSNQATQGET